MDQGLTYYTYPRLEKLNHYGDWQAEFESGALVYYERYEDELTASTARTFPRSNE